MRGHRARTTGVVGRRTRRFVRRQRTGRPACRIRRRARWAPSICPEQRRCITWCPEVVPAPVVQHDVRRVGGQLPEGELAVYRSDQVHAVVDIAGLLVSSPPVDMLGALVEPGGLFHRPGSCAQPARRLPHRRPPGDDRGRARRDRRGLIGRAPMPGRRFPAVVLGGVSQRASRPTWSLPARRHRVPFGPSVGGRAADVGRDRSESRECGAPQRTNTGGGARSGALGATRVPDRGRRHPDECRACRGRCRGRPHRGARGNAVAEVDAQSSTHSLTSSSASPVRYRPGREATPVARRSRRRVVLVVGLDEVGILAPRRVRQASLDLGVMSCPTTLNTVSR